MEPSSKRRKTDPSEPGYRQSGIIDFESREATRVSTASIFVLQADQLLKEAQVDYSGALKDVDAILHKLKNIVEAIPPHDSVPIHEATTRFEKKHGITIPFPDPKPDKDAPYKLSFERPAQCNVVGSYVSRTMIRSQPRYGIDMVVQMPRSMFQEKDYANMRYFYRRAYYIAYVGSHVKKQLQQDVELGFEYLNENPLLPILVLRLGASKDKPRAEKGQELSDDRKQIIRLIPCAPDDIIPRKRLVPSFNSNKVNNADDQSAAKTGTPFYNSTLKADSSHIHYLKVLAQARKECAALSDACVLGRIWLQQRGFGGDISQGGFGHFEWAVMIALLLKSGGKRGQASLSSSVGGPELFKAGLRFLSSTDFNKKPVVLGPSASESSSFRESGPVLYDSAQDLNILHKMTPWSADLLRHYAQSTTDLLANEAVDSFEHIFITKADTPLQNFDIQFDVQFQPASTSTASPDRRGLVNETSTDIYRTLKKAYGNRALMVYIQLPGCPSWNLASSPPSSNEKIRIGVMFDSVHMARQIEHGPSAEDQKDAARFRQFWGEKAELRRFKDGSILECLEWKSRLSFGICNEITSYILRIHHGIAEENIETFGQGFTTIVAFSQGDKEAFDAARRAFQTLEYDIRNLEDLPLQIRQLALVSPRGRYASIRLPEVGFHTGAVEALDVNIYFEASSKWPENLAAIQEAKIEFLLDIDRRLTTANKTITTYLGRENERSGVKNLAYLDIIYETGAAFRLRVHCDLEETILDRQVKNKTLSASVRDEAAEILANFQFFYTALPFHNQTIATYCTRLSPLSPTIRLVKHWFDSHKLSGHFSEELIELFVLHVFLQPYPWKIPTSASTGFLRTLFFLSRWNWRDQPLLIDTAETLTPEDHTAVRTDLEAWRKRDPAMNHAVLFVATSNSPSGLSYTRHKPSKLVASRMTRLAKAAYRLVKQESYTLDPSLLFESSLQDYDVLFHLSPKAVKSVFRQVSSSSDAVVRASSSMFKNLNGTVSTFSSRPLRAHPVGVLIEELERIYADSLVFFHGDVEDKVIGAIWNPNLRRQNFRAGLPYNFIKAESSGQDDDLVQVNQRAILLEIARIGGDIIRKIEEVD